jgi:hypothetical protein
VIGRAAPRDRPPQYRQASPANIHWRRLETNAFGEGAEVTNESLRKHAAEWAERTALEQGLPPKVTDPDVLREIARLLRLHKRARQKAE